MLAAHGLVRDDAHEPRRMDVDHSAVKDSVFSVEDESLPDGRDSGTLLVTREASRSRVRGRHGR